jgi:aminopeptidase N
MRTEKPVTIRREEYAPPPYAITAVKLTFDLNPTATKVSAEITFDRWADSKGGPLELHGEDLKLEHLTINGDIVEQSAFSVSSETLTIFAPPEAPFTLETVVEINPEANTRLEGLYLSDGIYCTQCEAEGFRRITYFLDRPDVMTTYEVEIRGDAQALPVLLSNGDLIEEGAQDDGRHFARWRDPWNKPSYLFALVAGDLGKISDTFTTKSGKAVDLHIWTDPGQEHKAAYAMDALKRSFDWDERIYGLEYDLGQFNIVAISAFNMGAMENKSLNVFNAKYILAEPNTATDTDYAFIESIVAHEYFHNWTGNRVTCRDWFQLSLKEGLTVFRDQQFSADERSAAVQRINDVKRLRARQFPEDAGPLAHPIRPDSYIEINNFYTATVYEKGAEVIGMMHTLLGDEAYYAGIKLYFERHDGAAATCDDFVNAMEDAAGQDMTSFRRWYSQAGTPIISVSSGFEGDTLTLTLRQKTPVSANQTSPMPLTMPIRLGLIGPNGDDVLSEKLVLKEAEQSWTFDGLGGAPVISLNRGFSAPIRLDMAELPETRAFRMAHDSDPFNRWEAGQRFATEALLSMVDQLQSGNALKPTKAFVTAWGEALTDRSIDPAFRAQLMTLPSEDNLADAMATADVEAVHTVRQTLRQALAKTFQGALEAIVDGVGDAAAGDAFTPDAASAGRRAEQAAALAYLTTLPDGPKRALAAYNAADNMTDRMAALSALNDHRGPERTEAMSLFHKRYADDSLTLDKWFALTATAPGPSTLYDIRKAMREPEFTLANPNKARSLIGAFAASNPTAFHAADGGGYKFFTDQILAIDKLNPQTAARMLAPLGRWKRMDGARQSQMQSSLKRILKTEGISRDIFEIADKALKG